jgi:hypothetical protein
MAATVRHGYWALFKSVLNDAIVQQVLAAQERAVPALALAGHAVPAEKERSD